MAWCTSLLKYFKTTWNNSKVYLENQVFIWTDSQYIHHISIMCIHQTFCDMGLASPPSILHCIFFKPLSLPSSLLEPARTPLSLFWHSLLLVLLTISSITELAQYKLSLKSSWVFTPHLTLLLIMPLVSSWEAKCDSKHSSCLVTESQASTPQFCQLQAIEVYWTCVL